jgi:hypothetical protein
MESNRIQLDIKRFKRLDCPFKDNNSHLADQQVRRLLVLADLTESHSSGTVTVGLLDTSGRGSRLTSSLGGEL